MASNRPPALWRTGIEACIVVWVDSGLDEFEHAIAVALDNWKIPVTPNQTAQFRRHFDSMIETNRTMNLTRITDPADAAIKHYADSLAMLPWAAAAGLANVTLLDVGTGAGFPAVPLAVMRPDWSILAIDGTAKKAEFVAAVARDLGLGNLVVEHAHTDHWPSGRKFELVATRAVASLTKCMRSARPRLKKDGRLVAYKSAALPGEEFQDAKSACSKLGMEIEPPFVYELKLGNESLMRSLRPVRRVS